jgi:hypothetical protein
MCTPRFMHISAYYTYSVSNGALCDINKVISLQAFGTSPCPHVLQTAVTLSFLSIRGSSSSTSYHPSLPKEIKGLFPL